MRATLRFFVLPIFVVSLALGLSACASSGKTATAPDAKKAGAKDKGAGVTESQPTADELARQQQEERDRNKQADIDRMKQEETPQQVAQQPGGAAPTALAATSTIAPQITSLEKIYFDFDKYEITTPSREVLARVAASVKGMGSVKVVVEGHCDERGTAEYNLALGERRASAAKKYLVSLGVGESHLYTISYGEEKPASAGHNEVAWSKNRRVQFSEE